MIISYHLIGMFLGYSLLQVLECCILNAGQILRFLKGRKQVASNTLVDFTKEDDTNFNGSEVEEFAPELKRRAGYSDYKVDL